MEALIDKNLALSLKEGLAVPVDRASNSREIIALHPKFAFIYMEVLAEQMASERQLHPVTGNTRDHVAISGYTLERLVQALLQPDDPQPHFVDVSPTVDEIEVQMAMIALQSVLPKDIVNVPTKKIIKLRNQYRDEMTAFQTYLHNFVTGLETLQEINDPVALKVHLEVEYEKKLKPQLSELEKCLRSLGIDTIMGALNVRAAIPPILASSGQLLHLAPINPFVVGAGAIAFGVFPVIRKSQIDARQLVRSSPAAYLLYAQETLEPAGLLSRVTQQARKMLFRV